MITVTALKIVIGILCMFFALCVACALWVGLRREVRPDPFSSPFGDVPHTVRPELPSAPKRAAGASPSPRASAARTQRKHHV